MKKKVAKKKRVIAKAVKPTKETKPVKAVAPIPEKPGDTHADRAAAKQRDISVSEFFLKNRHLLGFDNAKKALLTTVREAVDNSLDAREGMVPVLKGID